MKTEIKKLHLELDRNGSPKLILTDENGTEWSLSSYTTSADGCQSPQIVKKSDDWFFNDKTKDERPKHNR